MGTKHYGFTYVASVNDIDFDNDTVPFLDEIDSELYSVAQGTGGEVASLKADVASLQTELAAVQAELAKFKAANTYAELKDNGFTYKEV